MQLEQAGFPLPDQLIFSEYARRIAGANPLSLTSRLWDVETGRCLRTWMTYTEPKALVANDGETQYRTRTDHVETAFHGDVSQRTIGWLPITDRPHRSEINKSEWSFRLADGWQTFTLEDDSAPPE